MAKVLIILTLKKSIKRRNKIQFNIFDFVNGMNEIKEYIGDNPVLEIKDDSVDIYAISSALDGEKIMDILKENFNKYIIIVDRDSTGEYHIKLRGE